MLRLKDVISNPRFDESAFSWACGANSATEHCLGLIRQYPADRAYAMISTALANLVIRDEFDRGAAAIYSEVLDNA